MGFEILIAIVLDLYGTGHITLMAIPRGAMWGAFSWFIFMWLLGGSDATYIMFVITVLLWLAS